MLTLPTPPQTSHLVSAAQGQLLAACTSSEQGQAVTEPQRQVSDPAASSRAFSASVKDISPVSAVAVDQSPVAMHQQPSEPARNMLATASRLEASSQPPHGVTDSVTDGAAACVMDSRRNSVADGRMDSGTDIAVCAAASAVARQHHSCCWAGGIGPLRAGQDPGLAGHEYYTHNALQESLASVEDGLGSEHRAASAGPMDSATHSTCSSMAHSRTTAGHGTARLEGCSSSNTCSENASPVPSEPAVALRPSGDDAKPGGSVPNTAQLRVADAQTDMPPATNNVLAASIPEGSAAAMYHDFAPVASAVDSSASDDAQASSASGSVTSSSAGSNCVDLQTADSMAGQADRLCINSASSTEADSAQAGCVASPSARVAHDDLTCDGQSQVVLQGGRDVSVSAEPPACSPLQLLATGPGDRLTRVSAQLGILAGQGVSIMTGRLLEASGSRVAAAVESAVACEAQTEVVEIGVQTDANMSACMLDTGNTGGRSGVNRVVESRADTEFVESAQSVSATDSSSNSKPAARQAAASHHSLAAGGAESGAAVELGLTKHDRASSAIHAPQIATHSKANGIATGAPGNQTCLSNVVASQTDESCQAATQAGPCCTAQHQSESGQYTSSSKTSVVSNQALPCLLELVTVCGGHDSLKELIRADMRCFPYEKDGFLMSICGQIRESFSL